MRLLWSAILNGGYRISISTISVDTTVAYVALAADETACAIFWVDARTDEDTLLVAKATAA
ncbi:hypothetical protein [Solimicrobium silvestre]|uniref:hypothetical protein n=1 Tax=Solimicrobium silvestre TaxID=2099400 RepID=UPI000CFE26B3|nr:hypothetical protein [Solimicrobium silvestre]